MRVYKVLDDRFRWDGKDLDPLPPPRHCVIEGLDRCADLLGPGVYALLLREEVIYIAWASNVLERIADHRRLLTMKVPAFFPIPAIAFDDFHFRRCAEDIGETIVADLISRFSPKHNLRRATSHAASL